VKRNGFKFLIDEKGNKSAILIDLKKHQRLWEDFYDLMIVESRRESLGLGGRQPRNVY
jgi:hypothetical protein